MSSEELAIQQIQFLKEIYDTTEVIQTHEAMGILKEIQSYSLVDAEYALGNLGGRLKFFSGMIDLAHPDLNTIYNGRLVGIERNKFSREAVDRLKIMKFISQNDLSNSSAEAVRGSIGFVQDHQDFDVDSPTVNHRFIRLVGIREVRDAIRHTGVVIPVSLNKTVCQDSVWDKMSMDIARYARWRNPFDKDLEEAENRMQCFINHGLTSMAAEITRTVNEIQSKHLSKSLHGFNQVDVQSLSILLAKKCGYKPAQIDGRSIEIYLTKETFKGYNFFDEDRNDGSLFRCANYSPRMYGYRDLCYVPNEMSKLIDFLEEFPTLGKKAIFDDYRILVPGIDYPTQRRNDGNYSFKDPQGDSVKCYSLDAARKLFDATLVKEGHIPAVLLGMHDEEYYFISYWM